MKKRIFFSLALVGLLAGCQPISTTSTNSATTPDSSTQSSTTETSSSSGRYVENVDVVANTKLNLEEDLFEEVMARKSTASYDKTLVDFNSCGVERVLTEDDYAPNDEDDVFTNYVDGDTTQFTSYNGVYTVKVRYLAVDTPESTSEIEEWGKSASIFNETTLKSAKHIIVQSATSAQTGKYGAADIDTYGRSLAYVWYTTVEDPTLSDFRNLNLELVYEGYSLFNGAREDMSDEMYNAFMQANEIAEYYKKARYSGEEDPNYYYGSPIELGLDDIYDETYYTNTDGSVKYSYYCDEYTRYTFEGVVSRKVGSAFYIQDTIDGTPYGLYVFTLKNYAPIQVGNRIRVSGVLSWYGGAYELTGISYSFFNPQEGDIEYVLDEDGNRITEEIEPVEVTPAELQAGKYNCVLVKLKGTTGDDTLYFNTSWNQYNGEYSSYSFGGSEELNAYNNAYPFYNTDNSITVFGRFGSDMSNVSNSSTLFNTAEYIRVKIPSDILISDANDQAVTSYRYFTGTKDYNGNEAYHYYIPNNSSLVYSIDHADKVTVGTTIPTNDVTGTEGDIYIVSETGEIANDGTAYDVYMYSATADSDGNNWSIYSFVTGRDADGNDITVTGEDVQIYRRSYTRKKVTNVVGIAQQYESTSGKSIKYSLMISQANTYGEEGYDFNNFEEIA